MANTAPFSVANLDSTVDIGYTSTYSDLLNQKTGKDKHKSLDLSNVSMPSTATNASDTHLRQFHQMRIYVNDFGGMLHHGASMGGTHLITSNLPESFSYKIGSQWQAPLKEFGNAQINAFMQLVTSNIPWVGPNALPSGVNRATTVKVWGGAEPLEMELKIPVMDDGYKDVKDATGVNTNLQEALEFLGSLCLPKLTAFTGFYTPPPSPLKLHFKWSKEGEGFTLNTTPGRIMVQLGGILLIDNCIIESVSVNYPNTKTMIRHYYNKAETAQVGQIGTDYLLPLLAEVTIKITSVEAMTADYYSKMLWLKHNNMGTGEIDTTPITSAVGSAWNTLGQKVNSMTGSMIGWGGDTNKNDGPA